MLFLFKNVCTKTVGNEHALQTISAPTSVLGTGPLVSDIKAAPPAAPQKLLFLSNFDPLTTCDQVKSYILNQFDCSVQLCRKLVRKEVDVTSLQFVSFKISISINKMSLLLNPSDWPSGIRMGESIPKPSKNLQQTQINQTTT